MSDRILKFCLTTIFITIYLSAFSQENINETKTTDTVLDSLKKSGVIFSDNQKGPEIVLSTNEALKYLRHRFDPHLWKGAGDTFRQAIRQLIYETEHPAFDSLRNILIKYPFDSLNIRFFEESKSSDILKSVSELNDTTDLVKSDSLNEAKSSNSGFPFKYYNYPFRTDSIKAAVESLLNYLDNRDSTVIYFTGAGKAVTPIMINSKSGKDIRYWLKNELSDSVTVWIGNPSRNTIGLYLEQGVNFKRPAMQRNYATAKIDMKHPDNSKLIQGQKILVKQQYWKYRKESSFILSQASLTNWVKGGDNSISTSIDITGYADYNNTPLKLSSNNFIRLNLGFLKSGDIPLRKNLDLLETNSKLNHKAFGKFDFSAILLFKTQVALGYDFSSEPSVLVSKFMNPAILIVGLGLDYQPNKTTSLNFSPLSYKGTFITDTAHIDQTKYGIPKNRKSLNEPGVSFMITNEWKPLKTVSVINRLQLFTNYIHNPQNVDVDWEMIGVANLNWFTDVRLDTHLIFDDDTKTPELDKNKTPVLLPDGTVKKTARIQFKEIFGISFVFRF
jgi:Protein of unknown function (DUF3078).